MRSSVQEPAGFSEADFGEETLKTPPSHWAETCRARKAGRAPHSSPVALAAPACIRAGACSSVVAPRIGLKHSAGPFRFCSSPFPSQTSARSSRIRPRSISLSGTLAQAAMQPASSRRMQGGSAGWVAETTVSIR